MKNIPTTVITGSLGAGKTTLILNMVKQLPPDYKTLWLKNEYGDVNIDSELAKASNIQTKEILNGCLCCVLIGKLGDALTEIIKTYPDLDRLIIETAGTAYPYPIVNEINQVKGLKLDGLIMVVDTLNFEKFKDKSEVAKAQGKYIDLIVLNKAELVDEKKLDDVEDEVFEIYPVAPKMKSINGSVDLEFLIGQESKAKHIASKDLKVPEHNHDMDVFSIESDEIFSQEKLQTYLESLKEYDVYRIKGIINTNEGVKLLNYVVGRIDWSDLESYSGKTKITFIGQGISNLESKVKTDLELMI